METLKKLVEGAGLVFTPYDISKYNPPEWPEAVSQQWFLITHHKEADA